MVKFWNRQTTPKMSTILSDSFSPFSRKDQEKGWNRMKLQIGRKITIGRAGQTSNGASFIAGTNDARVNCCPVVIKVATAPYKKNR